MRSGQSGQVAVEFVAVLPLLVALLAGVWQITLLGHASWSAGAAARAAARAHALGLDPRAAARAHLPRRLERGVLVRESERSGEVTVTVRVPSVIGGARVGRVSATAAFAAQR